MRESQRDRHLRASPLTRGPRFAALLHAALLGLFAVLAVMAARGGDNVTAASHISRAQQQSRATARRERQLVEIATLVVTGEAARATGLALEHTVEFPQDADLLARVSPTGRQGSTRPAVGDGANTGDVA